MTDENATTVFRAAQYVRMSTEHQQYSTHNQADKIKEYAERRGIEIVRTYADDGKSGLSIGGRAALQKLIAAEIEKHGFTVRLAKQHHDGVGGYGQIEPAEPFDTYHIQVNW